MRERLAVAASLALTSPCGSVPSSLDGKIILTNKLVIFVITLRERVRLGVKVPAGEKLTSFGREFSRNKVSVYVVYR